MAQGQGNYPPRNLWPTIAPGPPKIKLGKKADESEEEDEGGLCSYCKKYFETDSKFLCHVTKSRLCQTAHEPELIATIKRKCRLKSKRKWFKGAYNSHIREERKEQRKKNIQTFGKANPNYVKKVERETFAGTTFWELFNDTWKACYQEARKVLVNIALNHELPKEISMEINEEALDEAFSKVFWAFNEAQKQDYVSEIKALEAGLSRMEALYEQSRAKEYSERQDYWRVCKSNKIFETLFVYAIDKAFSQFYLDDKFKNCFTKAHDRTLDLIFLDLVTKEHYFQYDSEKELEDQLYSTFKRFFTEEMKKQSIESGLQEELKSFISQRIEKRFKSNGLNFDKSLGQ